MDWKVVAQGSAPSAPAVEALIGLTGLARGEVLLALHRGTLVAASGISEERAQELGDRLSRNPGIVCRILPDAEERTTGPRFDVLLTGFAPGYRTRIRRKLQELTGLPPEQVVVWLSRMPFVLARNADPESARRIRSQVAAAGGVVAVEPVKGAAGLRAKSDGILFPPPSAGPAVATTRERVPAATASGVEERESPGPAPAPPDPAPEPGEPPVATARTGGFHVPPPVFARSPGWDAAASATPPPPFRPGRPPASGGSPPPPPRTGVERSDPPCAILFSPPPALVPAAPGIVGAPGAPPPAAGPAPGIALLHPPPQALSPGMLLPPEAAVPRVPLPSAAEDPGQDPPPVRVPAPLEEAPSPPAPVPEPSPGPSGDAPDAVELLPADVASPPQPVEEGPPPADGTFGIPEEVPERLPSAPSPGADGVPPVIAAPAPPGEAPVRREEAPAPAPGSAIREDPEAAATIGRARGRARRRIAARSADALPPARRGTPPAGASVHLYVCEPSREGRDGVVSALMEELGLDLPGATGLLDRCPAWLAGFRSSEKAAEIQTRLERKGVTVTRTRGPLAEVRSAAGPGPSPGFRAWLAADG